MANQKEEVLREIWFDPEDGFGSAKDTLKQAQKRDASITMADVKKFFEKQESLQRKRGKVLNSYVADYPGEQVQIDIADFSSEVAKDLSGLKGYARLLIARLRELGGEMDVGKAGTFLRAKEGFSEALAKAKVSKLRECLKGFEGWTVEGDPRAGGKTTLKLVRRRLRAKEGPLKQRETGGAKFPLALFAVDVFSKLAAVVPLSTKDPQNVTSAFAKALETFKNPVASIYTDDGGEFQKGFAEVLEKNQIQHLLTRGHAPFVERLIRTIKRMIFLRQENAAEDKPWHDYLESVVGKCNRSQHAATGFSPNEAHKPDNALKVHAALLKRGKFLKKYPPLKVGDTAKVLRKAGKVGERKERWNEWDSDKRTVDKIETGSPTLYILKGGARGYMRHELLKLEE